MLGLSSESARNAKWGRAMARDLACHPVRIVMLAEEVILAMGVMASHLRWDRRTLHQIGVATEERVAEDPEDLAATEAQEEDPTAATEGTNQILRGGTTEGVGKDEKEMAKAAQGAADLEMEVAPVGGLMVQDGGTMARMVTRSGQL